MTLASQCHPSASQDRLEQLIAERLADGADKAAIDRRIWDLFGERWAVMFTDLAGFSRGIADFGVTHFLQVIYESQRLLLPVVRAHDGIVLKLEGDSMLVIFRHAPKAVHCAIEMERLLVPYNRGRAQNEHVDLCVGVGYGDVLRIGDADVFGTEVNAAAKLGEDVAKAGDVLVTQAVVDACAGDPGFAADPIAATPPGARRAFRVRY